MGKKKPNRAVDDDNAPPLVKSKKKGFVVDDDEYSIGLDVSNEPPSREEAVNHDQDNEVVAPAGKRKGKKNNQAALSLPRKEEQHKALEDFTGKEDDVPPVAIVGKKKSRSKKHNQNHFTLSAFDALNEEQNENSEAEEAIISDDTVGKEIEATPVVAEGGKKSKPGKSGQKFQFSSAFDYDEETESASGEVGEVLDGVAEGDEEAFAAVDSGKKKSETKSLDKNLHTMSNFDSFNDKESKDGAAEDVSVEAEESSSLVLAGKKKSRSKKHSQDLFSGSGLRNSFEENKHTASGSSELLNGIAIEDEEAPPVVISGKKKSKTKKRNQNLFAVASFDALGDEETDGRVEAAEDRSVDDTGGVDQEVSPVIAGKKKSKSKKSVQFSSPVFGSHEEEMLKDSSASSGHANEDVIDNPVDGIEESPTITITGKKKSKSKKTSLSSPSVHDLNDFIDKFQLSQDGKDAEGEAENDTSESLTISLSGKKKSSKSLKKSNVLSNSWSFSALHEDHDQEVINELLEGKEHAVSSYNKKQLSVNNDVSFSNEDNINNIPLTASRTQDEDTMLSFSGKKKPSKTSTEKTKSELLAQSVSEGATSEEVSKFHESKAAINEKMNESEDLRHALIKQISDSTNKQKNKKKGKRTAREEEDLEKILAELGEAPSTAKPVEPACPSQENIHFEPDKIQLDLHNKDVLVEDEGEAQAVESAAAKKKKKKKEKEKEKKAAVASSVTEVESKDEKLELKSKGIEKKLPKHVREMQEALARRKEAEERKKKEEEERIRREEEECKKAEKAERLLQEAKKRKKEREKEKMLKKKQEGKLLTGKQKEEARKLEAIRNQFLSQSGMLPISDTLIRKPRYEKKKSKPNAGQITGQPTDQEEIVDAAAEHVSLSHVEQPIEVEKSEEVHAKSEEEKMVESEDRDGEDEDDEEWDAKSWDNAEVILPVKSAFADEDEEEEKPIVRKVSIKKPTTLSQSANLPVAPSEPDKISEGRAKDVSAVAKNVQVYGTAGDKTKAASNGMQMGRENIKKPETQSTSVLPQNKESHLRSPICCILGHVDTGKTKLLDCIRGTNVQEGEAGGITQQIGATYFPSENIRERTRELKADAKLLVPGLLVIDTPGHESFTNLRLRGSSLCDIAILVVDIMHGLEPQTIESLNLLKKKNTEFIVALNKVDRLYGWKTCRNSPIKKAIEQQSPDVISEFQRRLKQIITEFMMEGLNTELYYRNKHMAEQTYSIVPTSAVNGEGIPDLLLLLVQWSQRTMEKKLTFSDEIQCTVLEVKVIEGLGTTIDVVLVNGILHEGDQIVICGMQGPIVTTIRALLTPHPMKELRVKGSYLHHKEIKAAQGVKISAQGLEQAIAGTGLYVVRPEDDVEDVKDMAMEDMNSVMSSIDKSGEGVCVQASTIGSLEALLEFLKSPAVNIPVSGISIGPVHKKDVMRASVMLERRKEYATILAFDVKVTPEARELADEMGVRIFCADIIYHLFDQFTAYMNNLKEEKKKEVAEEAVFPCVLKIMPNCIFNKKDPIVLGIDVLEGFAKVGTPICVPSRDFTDIGRITSIEINHKQVDVAKKGQKVAIKIVGSNPEEQQKMYGRHFEIDDELVSHITRRSIDVLKANYREDLSNEEWKLVVKLKNLFKIL